MELNFEMLHKLAELESQYASATATLEQHKVLIERLEDDLLRVNTLQRTEAEGAPDPTPSPTEFLSQVLNGQGTAVESNKVNAGATADSLLPIIASQRERFRAKVHELEEQGLQDQQHMALLQSEMDKIRADNVKLYEKIKFLQSYQSIKPGARNDDTEARYQSQYESMIDPFTRFSMQEKQRKYTSLSAHEKATLGLGRWIMSSSQTRAIFFFYLIFLHCLVFIVLYTLAYTESCKRDAAQECVHKFREHMNSVHGEGTHG